MSPKQPPHDQSDSKPLTVVSAGGETGPEGADLDSSQRAPTQADGLPELSQRRLAQALEVDPARLTAEEIEQARRAVKLQREWNELRMEQAECRKANATAEVVEWEAACVRQDAARLAHRAEEAGHRAAGEPKRQEMDLTERWVTVVMAVVVTTFAMAFLTLAAIFQPWLIPTLAGAGGLALLLHRWRAAGKAGGDGASGAGRG